MRGTAVVDEDALHALGVTRGCGASNTKHPGFGVASGIGDDRHVARFDGGLDDAVPAIADGALDPPVAPRRVGRTGGFIRPSPRRG